MKGSQTDKRRGRNVGNSFYVLLLLSVALLVAAPSQAQELSNLPGAFVDIGFGARPSGLGGAYTALANDVNAVVWNPAGLADLRGHEATFSYARQLGLVPYHFAAFAGRLAARYSHGEAIIVSGDDAMGEVSFIATGATNLPSVSDRLNVGLSLRLRWAEFGGKGDDRAGSVTGNAFGIGLDVAAMYHLDPHLALAAVVKNAFDVLSWNSSSIGRYNQSLPLELVVGGAYREAKGFNLALDLDKALHSDTSDKLRLGLERRFFQRFTLRSGWVQTMGPEPEARVSLGGGIEQEVLGQFIFVLDVAYAFHDIGNTLKLSMTFQF